MRVFGLIGYPLGHSWSAGFFNAKFQGEQITDAIYKPFPIKSIDEFPALLEAEPSLAGLNVTIPYKEAVIPFLDALEEAASEIGAVNVIRFERSEMGLRLTGHNSDVHGFEQSLLHAGIKLPQKALVLGTGGASKAVTWVLEKLGCEYLLVSRNPGGKNTIVYQQLRREIIADHGLIINTTPLGMLPDTETFPPIPYQWLDSRHFLFDLVYNPPETLFLKKGKEQGCRTMNGEIMLLEQARKAWEIWNT